MILWIDPGIRKLWYALIDDNMKIVDAWVILLKWDSEKYKTKEQKVEEKLRGKAALNTKKREEQRSRMSEMYAFFEKMLETYGKTITTISMEKLYFMSRNQSNAEYVYGIRWALMMLFFRHGLILKEYTPIQLKKYVTWNAKASKELVMSAIQNLFGLKESLERHDTADALWLAYLGLKSIW